VEAAPALRELIRRYQKSPEGAIARSHLAHLALNAQSEFAVICGTVVNESFELPFTRVEKENIRAGCS